MYPRKQGRYLGVFCSYCGEANEIFECKAEIFVVPPPTQGAFTLKCCGCNHRDLYGGSDFVLLTAKQAEADPQVFT